MIGAMVGVLGVGGCGSDQPPVCDAADAVRTSVDHVRDTNVAENGLAQLQTNLTQLGAALDQMAADAQAQFATQREAVKSSAAQLSASVDAARADPNATTLSAVRSAASNLQLSFQQLSDAVADTC
jgi:hypothetical protein